jgi:Ca2+-binding EF-hand superfamily protein
MTMIPYEYFVKDLSGPLSGHRLGLVGQVWKLLDTDNSGYVDRPECAALFVAHLHPDVLEGIHDMEFVRKRFADDLFQGSEHLTWEDFKDRHSALSINIEKDSAFNLYIHDTWDLAGTKNRLKNLDQYTHPVENKFQTAARDVSFQRVRHGDHLMPGCKAHSDWEPPAVQAYEQEPEWMKPKGLAVGALRKLRDALKRKSLRGVFAIPVIFRNHDSTGDGCLSEIEFAHAFHGMNLGLDDSEIQALFNHFDHTNDGSVEYEEFVDGVRGPLNAYKLSWVRAVFQFLDVDHSGTLPLDDLRTKYDAKNHPMRHKGLMSAEEIYLEFLETFIDAAVQQPVRGLVTWDMFHNYYAMLGAQAPTDEHFAAVIQGTWGIGVDAVFNPYAPAPPTPPQPPFPKKVFGTQLTTPGEFLRSGKPVPKPLPPFASDVDPPRPPTMAEEALTVGIDVLMDRVRKAISCTNDPAMAGRTIIGCQGFGNSLEREEKLNGGPLDGEQLSELLLKVFVPVNAASGR